MTGIASAGQELLALQGVDVRLGQVQALRGATVAVRRGEFIALVGANGSGKTTLLRTLHGQVAVHGGLRSQADGGVRQAMLFQRPFLLRLSVWHNLRIALWLAGVPSAEGAARAEQALHRAGLASLSRRQASALSGGQQQRLALARAWATQPDVLFLDEPTANLDPSAKKEVETLLQAFHAEGMTLVMSTHNLGQAKRLASRVLYLDRGSIRVDLPTAAFFAEHVDERADKFLKGDLTWDDGLPG